MQRRKRPAPRFFFLKADGSVKTEVLEEFDEGRVAEALGVHVTNGDGMTKPLLLVTRGRGGIDTWFAVGPQDQPLSVDFSVKPVAGALEVWWADRLVKLYGPRGWIEADPSPDGNWGMPSAPAGTDQP